MKAKPMYTTRLGAGQALVDETRTLLELWSPGMSVPDLTRIALESGRFPTITARRLRNMVRECFAPRYLADKGAPAIRLQALSRRLPTMDFVQLLYLHTARANAILADFVRDYYWPRYAGGHQEISNEDVRGFVQRAIDDGRTKSRWSYNVIERVAGYLTGTLADYGLLEKGRRKKRRILSYRITDNVAAYLAYDLHFSGVGDHALLAHQDWGLFGLSSAEVLDTLRRLSLRGLLIVQAGGNVVRLSWKYPDMETLCDVLPQG